MAVKLIFSKIEKRKNFLESLPRFNLDLRIHNTKIEFMYTPISETLIRVFTEKKGILEVAAKQFREFENKSSLSPKKSKRKHGN